MAVSCEECGGEIHRDRSESVALVRAEIGRTVPDGGQVLAENLPGHPVRDESPGQDTVDPAGGQRKGAPGYP